VLKAQYKQSLLGYTWLLLNPVVQLITLSFVFSTLLKTPSQGVPFGLFLYTGLLPWLFFSTAILTSSESLLTAYQLVTSVYFPRELLVVAAVLARLADLVAGSLIFVALLIYHGYTPDATIVWVPMILVVQILFTAGLAMPIAAMNLFFHDVRFRVGVGLNLWFFVTPVMYPPEVVPERYQFLYDLNPLARFIASYRGYIFANESPDPGNLLVGVAMALGMLTFGFFFFKRLEPYFADRI
jgi:ABC-type polysaccharide/polyol phosphate export permease